jgi:hypothetical protein
LSDDEVKVLGYNLSNVESIEHDLEEKTVVLKLRYLSYQLVIDDREKLKQLIKVLNLFLKDKPAQGSGVSVPTFYSQEDKPAP